MKYIFDKCSDAVNFATKNKSFALFCSDIKNQHPDVHVHECCEIFLCIKGGESFLIDNKLYDINDGDLFVINQFEAHKVVPGLHDKFSRYIMHVHPSFLYANSFGDTNLSDCFYTSNKTTRISLSLKEQQKLCSLFEELKADYTFGDEMYKRLRATELLFEISKLFSTHNDIVFGEVSNRIVQLAIDFINNNYSSNITLDTVAKSAFISPTHLSRLFNRYCGTTVSKYIVGKRIAEAKKLLTEGKSVTDAAFMCGFNDYANFIRTFKKAVGVSPGKYKSTR